MNKQKSDDEFEAVVKRLLSTPPKPHADSKVKSAGKPKTKPAGGSTKSLQDTEKRRKTKQQRD